MSHKNGRHQNGGNGKHHARESNGRPTNATPAERKTGSVIWFDPVKGYGFIKPEAGDRDIFVHVSAVQRAQLDKEMKEGKRLSFELHFNRQDKPSAVNLQPLA